MKFTFGREAIPRARLEREALVVNPPPRGQNVRAPVDGVGRCNVDL
jgi:hypothetical protein